MKEATSNTDTAPAHTSGKQPGKQVALSLGSGGARGYAHIGVIKALEARGYDIVNLSGCSMGAIVGGCYVAGKLPEFTDWVSSLRYVDVLRLVEFSFMSSGAIKLDKVYAELHKLVEDAQIEDLSIPFTSVATELVNRKEVWFQKGSLLDAMRASAAIPGIFEAVQIDNKVYVDGAVLNPLPISPCVSAGADVIIAVDLSSEVPVPELTEVEADVEQAQREKTKKEIEKRDWFDSMVETASGLLQKRASPEETKNEANQNIGKLGVLSQSLETIQRALSRYKTAGYPPDLMIRMPSDACEIYDFHRADEIINLGYHIANRALDDYERGQSGLYGQC